MTALLNIAKSEDKPFYIDPSDVVAMHVDPEKNELTLYSSKGQLCYVGGDYWNLDAVDVVQKLAAHGTSLLPLSVSYGGDKKYVHYIAPRAVTYATISKPTTDGRVGAIIGVKGVGQEETTGATQAEIDTLLEAVRAVKPLLAYKPEQARSRWIGPAALYIDPKSVTEIRDGSPFQVDVTFEQSGRLDIRLKEVDVNDLVDIPAPATNVEVSTAFQEAARRKQELDRKIRLEFVNNIASLNGTLINIVSPEQSFYLRKEDIGHIYFYDDIENGSYIMVVEAPKTAFNAYPTAMQVYYKSSADRLKAFEDLNKQLATPPVTPRKQHKPKL